MTVEESKKHPTPSHQKDIEDVEDVKAPEVEETLAEKVDEDQPQIPTSEHSLDDLVHHPQIPYLDSKPAPSAASFLTSSKKSSDKGHVIQLLILMVVGAGVVAATVYLLRGGTLFDIGSNSTATPSPSVAASAEPVPPSPSPAPKAVDRSAYTIRVLNGTGKSGLAAKIAGQLKDLGYKTEKVGNATNSAFKQTVVRVKSGEDALLEQLVKDLSGDFEADGQASLKSSESVDAEIILGAK